MINRPGKTRSTSTLIALAFLFACTPSTHTANADAKQAEQSVVEPDGSPKTPDRNLPQEYEKTHPTAPGQTSNRTSPVTAHNFKPVTNERTRPAAKPRPAPAHAAPETKLPASLPVPGGIAVVTVGASNTPRPLVFYGDSQVYVTRRGNYWVAAIGVPLKAETGQHSVLIKTEGHPDQKLLFDIEAHSYKSQSLTIANKRKVNPNPQDQQRIERDWVAIQKAKTAFSTESLPDLKLDWPLKGRISSEFGLRRIYNGQPRSPHSGLDIAAPTGTPIVSPAAGTVIETGDFFFNGQTAFVDHGHGLVTMFCHMSDTKVNVGDVLKAGDLVGLVGETGRVTGPHLHLGVLLNGELINPTLLLKD